MNTFKTKNAEGQEQTWKVEFDAILLDDIQQATGVDLADLSAGGLSQTQTDVKLLVRVLAVCFQDKIYDVREWSKTICGDTITQAKAAVLGAAECFFPPSEWSAMHLHLKQRMASQRMVDSVMALKGTDTSRPSDEVLAAMLDELTSTGTSSPESGSESAGGQPDTLSSAAMDSPENAELTAVG